jgi:serine protease AprX
MNASRVIIEIRKPLAGSLTMPGWEHLFEADGKFAPVRCSAPTPAIQASLDSAGDELVLVRGHIDDRLREGSRKQLFELYDDSQIAPFHVAYGVSNCDDWLVDVGSHLPINSRRSPCDVDPTRANGCLFDVATYLGAEQVWENRITGEGVVVGIVDGGIWAEGRMDPEQPGVVPRVIDGWPAQDWGTIAGWRRHGNMLATDVLGIAPKASLYDIRISDSSHTDRGRMSDAIAGIHWAIEKYRATGTPHILCCGWGIYRQADDPKYATDPHHPLTRKIVEALDEGMIVLFAAGNGGDSCPASWCGDDCGPGKSIWGANGHPRVLSVGAVNKHKEVIGYSSQGPAALDEHKPDVCGVSHFAGYFCSDSGTSAACAVTAGVVALLKQARPALTQEAAKRALKSTAKPVGPASWNHQTGSGVIQAKAAFDAILAANSDPQVDRARLERLELENRCLREMFLELALEKRMRGQNQSDTP